MRLCRVSTAVMMALIEIVPEVELSNEIFRRVTRVSRSMFSGSLIMVTMGTGASGEGGEK